MGLDTEAAAAAHQHDMLLTIDPRGGALEVRHLERDLLGVVGRLVKHGDADGRGHGAVGVVRLAQVNAAASLAAVADHETQVVILSILACFEIIERLVDLQHAPLLRESLDVGNLHGGVDDRPADAVVHLILLFQAGEQQRDAPQALGEDIEVPFIIMLLAASSWTRGQSRRPALKSTPRLPSNVGPPPKGTGWTAWSRAVNTVLHHGGRDVRADTKDSGGRAAG